MKTVNKIILGGLLGISSLPCFANDSEDLRVYLGAKSYHYDRGLELNEINPSIGVEYKDFSVMYVHKNSYENKSVYAMWTPEFYKTNNSNYNIELGIAVGFATGYNFKEEYNGKTYTNGYMVGNLLPVIGLTSTYKFKNVGLNMLVTPAVSMWSVSYNF